MMMNSTATSMEEGTNRPSNNNNTMEPTTESSTRSHTKIQFLTGMKQDIQARLPYYWDDWKFPKDPIRVLNSTWFVFVVQLIPALIFAQLLDTQTYGRLSVAEVIFSAGLISVIYAFLAGQPLVLLGITGPVAILLGKSYRLAEDYDAEYFTFFWWLCIWSALLHMLSAMFGVVNFVWYITPFTTQIFEFFIASTFIYSSIRDFIKDVHLLDEDSLASERSAGYTSLVIGAMTFVICWKLHFTETWPHFTRGIRTFLKSYNMLLALVIMTAASYLPGMAPGLKRVEIRRIPWDWLPTTEPGVEPRPWVAHPLDGIDVRGIFGALFPAFMLYLLFFIDHNISSKMTQDPKYHLQKPSAYHWDFFVLGLTIIPCGILGIPPGSGLIPEAPLHSKSLCKRTFKRIDGVQRELFSDCAEQRWSALGQALLMFAILAVVVVISWIPVGCLFGIFLYLGVDAMHGNEIWERINLMFMYAHRRPPIPVVSKTSSWGKVQFYTLIQFTLAMLTFVIAQFFTWGYVFPALIALYVPTRSFVVSRLFSEDDLYHLDPTDGASEEEEKDSRDSDSDGEVDPTGKVDSEDRSSA